MNPASVKVAWLDGTRGTNGTLGTIETIETIIFAPFPSADYHRGKWSEGDRIITISITISIIYNIIIINLLYI